MYEGSETATISIDSVFEEVQAKVIAIVSISISDNESVPTVTLTRPGSNHSEDSGGTYDVAVLYQVPLMKLRQLLFLERVQQLKDQIIHQFQM